ncbi:MAG: hypothetical protein PWQ88_138 [Candidatus Methanomethylophilaceae archaeon]|nr:hypothetical protein [Candidatus Methanomethylophilaceae archaeon]MDI3541723.1 hypothetical protein [Candidatus Methanomethylophilaceae archaeon]
MHYVLEIRIPCSPEHISAVMGSLGPDNEGFVTPSLGEDSLIFRIDADDAGRLRQIADDLLACLKVVEDIMMLL